MNQTNTKPMPSLQAFTNLPHLQKLELQYNSLEEFSLGVFRNTSGHPDTPLFLNLSHNVIRFALLEFLGSEILYNSVCVLCYVVGSILFCGSKAVMRSI